MKQYIVAGGDKRIFYLAEYLKKQGNAVDTICVPGWEETQTVDEIFQMQAGGGPGASCTGYKRWHNDNRM